MWFLGIALAIGSTLRGYGRPGLASILAGLSMVVTIGLDLILIPDYGVTGAAVASAVAYALYGASSVVALARVAGLSPAALIVPTRTDIGRYPRAARRAAHAVRLGGATDRGVE
jgi:Na+-driven multidrug efflux pump